MNEKMHFCESCAFSAGQLLARIAELEAAAAAQVRRHSGVVLRKIAKADEEPVTQREPSVTRKLAASCL